jgi:glyoxylase-like metal-dependent hydrolase (beta-lactamase superfamily II)
MLGEELRPGLWAWTGSYRDWKGPVNSCALRRPDEVVLVDPLLEDGQWPGLERLVGRRRVQIVLTTHWHARSAAALAARFPGTRVWANSRARAAVARRVEPTDVFAAGDELPGGLLTFAARPRTEVVLWDPAHHALIAGDALLGGGEGDAGGRDEARLRLTPASWLPQSTDLEALRAALRPLLDLPVEVILVSHGAPVTAGAGGELRRVLAG